MTRKAIAAVVIIAVALVFAWRAVLRRRAEQAGDRLVERIIATETRVWTRASHAPVPGTLSAALAPRLAVAPSALWWEKSCAVTLTPKCREAWERDRQWAVDVLSTSRAETWSRVPGLHGQDLRQNTDVDVQYRFSHALHLGALEVQQRPPEAALELCADALGLARDQALGGGLMGMGTAVRMHALYMKPCATALAAAPPQKRAWARGALQVIQDGWPPTGDWVANEMVEVSVKFWPDLTAAQRARLPANVKRGHYSGGRTFAVEGLFGAASLPADVAMFEKIDRALALEPSRRDAALAAVEARAPLPDWPQYFKLEDDRRDALRELIDSVPEPRLPHALANRLGRSVAGRDV